MSAPAGNNFWERRSKHGRDKIFESPEIMWEAACEYFQDCIENPWHKTEAIKSGERTGDIISVPVPVPFTIKRLCLFLGVNSRYFNQFEKSLKDKTDQTSQDFSSIITRIEEIIYTQKFEGSAVGIFNANIISRELGLAEKIQEEGTQKVINYNVSLSKEEVKQFNKDLEDEY